MAENINIAGRLHSTATGNVVAGANEIYDDTKGKKQSVVNQETDAALDDRYTKSQTYNKTELNNMITTPNQQYVTVTATDQTTAATDVLPATGSADTTYRVGNWDGSQFDASVYSEYAWDGSQYVHLSTKTQVGEVFDISAYHATGGTLATYADLAAALDSNNGGGVPQSLRKGGMSVKYVHTSDNKYVQYRLMSDSFNATPSNWQGVDATPISNSKNLVESGGVKNELECLELSSVKQKISNDDSDLEIGDENGNVILECYGGHIRTKNFDSKSLQQLEHSFVEQKESDGNSNLNIGDENGNVIIEAYEGHIRTKNFDSKSLSGLSLDRFKNKTIGIIGDSISTFNGWLPSDIPGYNGATYATFYPYGSLTSVEQTWWYQVSVLLGIDPLTNLSNCAWSGSTVRGNSESEMDAAAGCSTRRINDLSLKINQSPDIIICYIGCNDWGNNISLGNWQVFDGIPAEGNISTFREAYALMLSKLHSTYPLARVFCCTNIDEITRDRTHVGWPPDNASGITTTEWNANIIEIAEAFGCSIINLHSCGICYQNLQPYYCEDSGLHPNPAGHKLIARRVVSELLNKY